MSGDNQRLYEGLVHATGKAAEMVLEARGLSFKHGSPEYDLLKEFSAVLIGLILGPEGTMELILSIQAQNN